MADKYLKLVDLGKALSALCVVQRVRACIFAYVYTCIYEARRGVSEQVQFQTTPWSMQSTTSEQCWLRLFLGDSDTTDLEAASLHAT